MAICCVWYLGCLLLFNSVVFVSSFGFGSVYVCCLMWTVLCWGFVMQVVGFVGRSIWLGF